MKKELKKLNKERLESKLDRIERQLSQKPEGKGTLLESKLDRIESKNGFAEPFTYGFFR